MAGAGPVELRAAIENELIQRIMASSPTFFENLVVELQVVMGDGGSLAAGAHARGRSGDGGIDGIIKEDKLAGLDPVARAGLGDQLLGERGTRTRRAGTGEGSADLRFDRAVDAPAP